MSGEIAMHKYRQYLGRSEMIDSKWTLVAVAIGMFAAGFVMGGEAAMSAAHAQTAT